MNEDHIRFDYFFGLLTIIERFKKKDYDSIKVYSSVKIKYTSIVWKYQKKIPEGLCFFNYKDKIMMIEFSPFIIDYKLDINIEKYLSIIMKGKSQKSFYRRYFKKMTKNLCSKKNQKEWISKGLKQIQSYLNDIDIKAAKGFIEPLLFFLCTEPVFSNLKNSNSDSLKDYLYRTIKNCLEAKQYTIEEMENSQRKIDVFFINYEKIYFLQDNEKELKPIEISILVKNIGERFFSEFEFKIFDSKNQNILSKTVPTMKFESLLHYIPDNSRLRSHYSPYALDFHLWEGSYCITFYLHPSVIHTETNLKWEILTANSYEFNGNLTILGKSV